MKRESKMKRWKNRNRNKGFSLVELIITIAILGIISVSIVLAMTSSSKTYRTSSVEAQLQSEAQLVANAISEIAMDASGATDETTEEWKDSLTAADKAKFTASGLDDYVAAGVDNKTKVLILDATENLGTVTAPSYRKVQYIVAEANADKTLYLSKRCQDDAGNWEALDDFSLLGNYIEDLTVDTDRVEQDNLLEFQLDYTKNERVYKGKYQVLMRNRAYAKEEPQDEEPTGDIKLIANIKPKYMYLAMVAGQLDRFYEGAVVDSPTYLRSGASPITFKETHVSNQRDSMLVSNWELTGVSDGKFSLSKSTPVTSGTTLVTSNDIVINATPDEIKNLGYDSFGVKYSITTQDSEGNTVSSNPALGEVRILRIKKVDVAATSGFSTTWKEGWNGSETPGVAGYALTDATGKALDMGIKAIVDCTEWVPFKGGISWTLELDTGNGYQPCNDANFAKLAVTSSPNSLLNTIQFGKSAKNGQKYRVTATSLFDDTYYGQMEFGIGSAGPSKGDGFYSRGYYVDLQTWFEKEFGISETIGHIDIGSMGDNWEAANVKFGNDKDTGRIFMYVDYDSFAYSQPADRVNFYNGKGEYKFYAYESGPHPDDSKPIRRPSDTSQVLGLVAYHMQPVMVQKMSPTGNVVVVAKGSSATVKVKTEYYNIISKDYLGLYVDDIDTNLNRAGMYDYNKDVSIEPISPYGDVYNYVDNISVSITPKTGNKDYNPDPIRVRIAALDYYSLLRKEDNGTVTYKNNRYKYDPATGQTTTTNGVTDSYTDYTVYIANVKGQNVFIPGPKTDGDSAKIDGVGITWGDYVSDTLGSTPVTIGGYLSDGTKKDDMGTVYVKNGKYTLKYNGTEYTYNNTYHYWNK